MPREMKSPSSSKPMVLLQFIIGFGYDVHGWIVLSDVAALWNLFDETKIPASGTKAGADEESH
jgi:hypothetical protein